MNTYAKRHLVDEAPLFLGKYLSFAFYKPFLLMSVFSQFPTFFHTIASIWRNFIVPLQKRTRQ